MENLNTAQPKDSFWFTRTNIVFVMRLYMQFTIFWIIVIGIRWILNVDTSSINFVRIRTETRQRINEVHCSRGIYSLIYLFMYIWLQCPVCFFFPFYSLSTLMSFVLKNIETRITIAVTSFFLCPIESEY